VSAHAEFDPSRPAVIPTGGVLGVAQGLLDRVNAAAAALSAVAAGLAGCVLTWEVIGRYFLKLASDWQDEMSIFLLVGATFLSAGWIQSKRGHVGIDALAHILPRRVDRARRIFADLASLAFCAFFCWKSWTLLGEAWEDGPSMDYNLSVLELNISDAKNKSAGTLIPACQFTINKDKELDVEAYQNPWRLVDVIDWK